MTKNNVDEFQEGLELARYYIASLSTTRIDLKQKEFEEFHNPFRMIMFYEEMERLKDKLKARDSEVSDLEDKIYHASRERDGIKYELGHEIEVLNKEVSDLTRKGEELCHAYGNSEIKNHDLAMEVEKLKINLAMTEDDKSSFIRISNEQRARALALQSQLAIACESLQYLKDEPTLEPHIRLWAKTVISQISELNRKE